MSAVLTNAGTALSAARPPEGAKAPSGGSEVHAVTSPGSGPGTGSGRKGAI